jgi:cytochrome b561
MLGNSPTRYGTITKTLHWVTAILVLLMLALGIYMTDVEEMATKLMLYNRHKSLGVLVLALTLLRVLWHLYSKKPAYVESLKPWEKRTAHVVHTFLYIALLGMPMTGWLMSSAAGRAVSFFGLFTLPDLVGQDKALGGIFRETHEILSDFLMAAIALHVAGALKHHFIDKDITLKRMLPFVKVP